MQTPTLVRVALALACAAGLTGCAQSTQDALAARGIAPIYNAQTGKLEQLLSDRDGDGRKETRAYMDGTVIKYIEIDRTGDGAPDRWEYYVSNLIDHAEEVNGPGKDITRREFFLAGVIKRVVDDVDLDGRPDKWETYEDGVLARVELDLVGKGYSTQRLSYDARGTVTLIESDPEGDGVFVRILPDVQRRR